MLEDQISTLKMEIKKLKRKNLIPAECEMCKLKTNTGSMKKIESSKNIEIDDIIRETEKLSQSNRKIENLISNHEINSQHSIEIREARYLK